MSTMSMFHVSHSDVSLHFVKKFALRGRRVCGNRYNKRLAVQFNILTSAGGARGTHWTGTNEDAGVYL